MSSRHFKHCPSTLGPWMLCTGLTMSWKSPSQFGTATQNRGRAASTHNQTTKTKSILWGFPTALHPPSARTQLKQRVASGAPGARRGPPPLRSSAGTWPRFPHRAGCDAPTRPLGAPRFGQVSNWPSSSAGPFAPPRTDGRHAAPRPDPLDTTIAWCPS